MGAAAPCRARRQWPLATPSPCLYEGDERTAAKNVPTEDFVVLVVQDVRNVQQHRGTREERIPDREIDHGGLRNRTMEDAGVPRESIGPPGARGDNRRPLRIG